jgi:mannose-6-phosphate isomerase
MKASRDMPQKKELIGTQTATVALPHAATSEEELRPWGSFAVLEEGPGYRIKRIEMKPGHHMSLRMHHHRSEHWIVISGIAKVICDNKEILLSPNQSTYVPQFTRYRLENPGMIPLVLIEVQNGEYLGEDDVTRFEDVQHFPQTPLEALTQSGFIGCGFAEPDLSANYKAVLQEELQQKYDHS